MHVKPYEEHSGKKEQVTKMFDNIAHSYDLLNHFLSAGIDRKWRKQTIACLSPFHPKTILDVATGTGDLALEAHKQLLPDQIIGIDLSGKMIEVAQTKINKKNLQGSILVSVGDSEHLDFESRRFDAVTAGFGIRNFEDLQLGLSEMFRVLKPGGSLAILEFTRPRHFPFKQIFNLYFKYILPVIGKIKSKDQKAYRYLYESVQAFPDLDQLTEILTGIGFKDCKWKSLSLGICAIYTARKPG